MLEHIADFTAWPILTGILVGYVANRIMSGEGKGCCLNLIMGIIGSYAGTFISHLLNMVLLVFVLVRFRPHGGTETFCGLAQRPTPTLGLVRPNSGFGSF